jgi:acyl-[acyl-carrier-protein] desaturase
MSVSKNHQEKMYRAYMEFFDTAERKRRWHLDDSIPWERLRPPADPGNTAICVETFCGVELYVPDYTANGFNLTRPVFGHAWFQANWGYEESKHALAFREYLLRSGLRTEAQYAEYEASIFSKVWNLPFHTRRQMSCYGTLQEMATYLIYAAQRDKHAEAGDEVLQKIFFLVSRDEAAHFGFYRKVLKFEMEDDPQGTLEDLAHVVHHFRMPGVDLIPEYARRLATEGVGISSENFLRLGLLPTLKSLGVTRVDLAKALRRRRAHGATAPDAVPISAATGA